MASKERERVLLEARVDVLRKLEVAAAAKEPVSVATLAAIRELLTEAQAELED